MVKELKKFIEDILYKIKYLIFYIYLVSVVIYAVEFFNHKKILHLYDYYFLTVLFLFVYITIFKNTEKVLNSILAIAIIPLIAIIFKLKSLDYLIEIFFENFKKNIMDYRNVIILIFGIV